MQPDSDTVATIGEAILRYLRAHPQAADNADGIRQWWLCAPGPRPSVQQVEAALDRLLGRGLVRRQVMPDGRTLYVGADVADIPERHD